MYFSAQSLLRAIDNLSNVHMFLGITFLVCKKIQLPVGTVTNVSLDTETKKFMDDVHKLSSDSMWYFQPYKTIRDKDWVNSRYPSTGLQKNNTTTFRDAFIHKSGSKSWGWKPNYVSSIKKILDDDKRQKAPLLDMAIWILKGNNWNSRPTNQEIVNCFINLYHLTERYRQ